MQLLRQLDRLSIQCSERSQARVADFYRQAEKRIMLRWTCLLLLGAWCGCASAHKQMTLSHAINVPSCWRAGSDDPAFPNVSVAARYVSAYDRGWWRCVQKYVRDIGFQYEPTDLGCSGWPEETDGWSDGFLAASGRIESLIARFGKERVSEYLAQFRIPDAD